METRLETGNVIGSEQLPAFFISWRPVTRSFLLCCLFFLRVPPFTCAQTTVIEGYTIRQFTDENGLPQNSINSIAADNAGFLWLATENGLVRFDGKRFKVVDNLIPGAAENRVSYIHPALDWDRRRSVSGFYAMLPRKTYAYLQDGRATVDLNYSKYFGGFPFFESGRSNIFSGWGLPTPLSTRQGKPLPKVMQVANARGTFYLCRMHQVEYYQNWKKKSKVPFPAGPEWNCFVHKGDLFFLNKDASLTRIRKQTITRTELTGDILTDPKFRGAKEAIQIFWNLASDQVFLYLNKNLYGLRSRPSGGMETKLLLKNFDLPARNTQSVYFDERSRSLYLGSLTEGLFVVNTHQFEAMTTEATELDNVFYAQALFGRNSVITPSGVILGKENGVRVSKRASVMRKINTWDTRSITVDDQRRIWVKSYKTIFRYSPDASEMTGKWVMDDEITSLYLMEAGLWIGTRNQGVFYLDIKTTGSIPDPFLPSPGGQISYINSGEKGQLLLGIEQGLYEVSLADRTCKKVPGTEDLYVKSIYAPCPDQVWVSTGNRGFLLYHKGRVTMFPLDKRKYLAQSHCMVEDELGYFWIPTNKGLFRISKNDLLSYASKRSSGVAATAREQDGKIASLELFYEYYDKTDGFMTNEFNGGCEPCSLKLPDGHISLPSLKGLVWFKPEEIKSPLPDGPIFVDKVTYNNGIFDNPTDTLWLGHNPENVRLFLAKPFFGNFENLHFSYALNRTGSPRDLSVWLPCDQDLSIIIPVLKSGTYTLLVRKLNGFGLGNYTYKKILIIVPMFWYESWWARVLFVALAILAVYVYNQFRLKKIRNENSKLELMVTRRTDTLNHTLDELSRSNTDLERSKNEVSNQLQMMSRLLSSMTHDIQSPLSYIVISSREIPSLIRKGETGTAGEVAELIWDSSKRMSDLLKDLLDYIKTQVYQNSLKMENINLRTLLNTKFEIFRSLTDQGGNRVINDVPDFVSVNSDYQLLAIVIHNLVDNASKYTRNGLIRAWVAGDAGNGVHLVLVNNGIPMEENLIAVFSNIGPEESAAPTVGRKAGLGLLIVREIAVLLGITIKVEQSEATEFHLIFP